MSLTPTFQPVKPQWRGNTSSEDMNQNLEQIIYDLNTIFSEASHLAMDLNNLESKIRNELGALNSRVYAVSGMMTSYDVNALGYKMFYENFYLTSNIVYPDNLPAENRCVVNGQFGVATLPVNNSFSKVYTVSISDGSVYVAPDLSIAVTPVDETGSVRIDETNVINAFDGSDETVWERKVRFNSDYSKDSVSCRMDVTMPSVSNPYVNNILIKPYPEGAVDVQMITYDTLVTKDNVLPGFPAEGENLSKPTLYICNNIQPINFKVYLRQRNNKMEDGYKTFNYGLREFGVEKVEYKSSGKFAVRFTLPEYETDLISKVTSLITNPAYDNIAYKVSLYTSDAYFQADNPVWTSNNSPITTDSQLDVVSYITDSLWVMIEMTQTAGNSDSPAMESVTVTYSTST